MSDERDLPADAAAPGDPADPLSALQSAWRGLEPPDPTAAVDEPDPATRATIDWLRAAYRASETPIELPWALRRRLALRRTKRIVPWLAAAAAALLAVWLATRETPAPPEAEIARHVVVPGPIETPLAAPTPAPLVPVVVSADRMELRSGSVRFILLTPNQESNR
jgi:hypothetical protein